MTIDKKMDAGTLTVMLAGRLDTRTSPELEAQLNAALPGPKRLVLDLTEIQYLSSAGLRVLLAARKALGGGEMAVRGASEAVMEVLEITGFTDILSIE